MTSDETRAILSDEDVKILRLLAGFDMKLSRVAAELYMHRNTLTYRLDLITRRTGLDPRVFWELVELLRIVDGREKRGESVNREQ